MDEELKPCPFCGGEVVLTTNSEYREERPVIVCYHCEFVIHDLYGSEIYVAAWNRRANDEHN